MSNRLWVLESHCLVAFKKMGWVVEVGAGAKLNFVKPASPWSREIVHIGKCVLSSHLRV